MPAAFTETEIEAGFAAVVCAVVAVA